MREKMILLKGGILVSDEYDCQQLDVLIKGDKIVEVSPNIMLNEEVKIIQADGLYIAPGFVNIHAHDDFYLAEEEQDFLKSICFQGVTTSVAGNCGISNFPVVGSFDAETDSYQGFLYYKQEYSAFRSLSEFVHSSQGLMTFNMIPLIGHGTLRIQANGFKQELAASDLETMKKLLLEFYQEGGCGLSSGLMYMPGTFSETTEIIELINSLPDKTNFIYASHMRGYSDTFLDSVQEAIDIGEATGISVECSHLGPFGTQYKKELFEALKKIEDANRKGLNVGFDTLVYCGGSTTIMAIVPPWFYTEGIDKFLTRLGQDDQFFMKVVDVMESYIPTWPSWEGQGWTDNFVRCLGWDNLVVLSSKNISYRGKSITEIATEHKCSIRDAFRKIIIEEEGRAIMMMRGVGTCTGEEGDDMQGMDSMIEHPNGTIAIDAIINEGGKTMPYAYGTFPRVIKRYVKERKSLTLQQAIRKFTTQPLAMFGIDNRGHLRAGNFADIVVFNLEEITDNHDASTGDPQLASGVKHLLVNGEFVIENELYKPRVRNGKVILREER